MNGSKELLSLTFKTLSAEIACQVVVFPPFPYLGLVSASSVEIGAQNAHHEPSGAFTGEVSLAMLKDLGISWVLLGHSERRKLNGETDELVGRKLEAALRDGFKTIVCVGESEQERTEGITEQVIERQLNALPKGNWNNNVTIAYEPVWAIGTGKVATAQQAQAVHSFIRRWLQKHISSNAAETVRVIYGGSVTAANCEELAKEEDVDGFLVGGASLKPEFRQIIVKGAAAKH